MNAGQAYENHALTSYLSLQHHASPIPMPPRQLDLHLSRSLTAKTRDRHLVNLPLSTII